jgi:Ca-activated chloride channel family protein
MPDLAAFHFLRPSWLLVIVPAIGLWLLIRRRLRAASDWREVIAPHLLAHLRVGGDDRWRFRPVDLIVLVLVVGSLGVAGPTWEREVSPFAEDSAPLVVAMDLSPTMNATDVQPTRLERAKQKLRDLLALREGSRTALIAYAGSAHLVLPLSDDPAVFETFLAGLAPDVMPKAGKSPLPALALAEELLKVETEAGSILFLTDGIAAGDAAGFRAHADRSSDEVLVLAVGTRDGGPVKDAEGHYATDTSGRRVIAKLDLEGFEALRAEAGVFVAGATADDSDVARLQRRVQSHLKRVQREDETARWRDAGYWLVYPVVLLGLLWFRRGWTVRWGAAALALFGIGGCSPTGGELWWTHDQQGRRLFEAGRYADAAERFDDFLWRGVSLARAGDWEAAIDSFARVSTPEADYNLGNAYAALERWDEAIASWDAALAVRFDWSEALENRAAVVAMLEARRKYDDEDAPPGDPHFSADQIEFSEKGEKGKRGEVQMEAFSNEQLSEMWMRRLSTTPADFLRFRFAAELDAREETGS